VQANLDAVARTFGSGVSAWLFAGQVAASIGFVIYSVLVDNTTTS